MKGLSVFVGESGDAESSPKRYLVPLCTCTVEPITIKFQDGTAGATDRTFFGEWGSFRRNYLKKGRKKRLG